jgi:cell wall assembly regulator SMI1
MEDLWRRIERALAALDPDLPANLRPGASEASIQRAEKAFGLAFPADFRASLTRHESSGMPLGDGWRLDPLADLVRRYHENKELIDDGTITLAEVRHVRVRGPVRSQKWNLAWLPVGVNGSSSRLILDLDPAAGGTPGQLVEQSREGQQVAVVAPSFTAWMERFAADLEAGRYLAGRDAGVAELRRRD